MYEIPQQLEYKEKIMFGLTFKQLAYAAVFGILILLLLKKLGTTMLSWSLISAVAMIGVAFVYFDIDRFLKNILRFFHFRNAEILDKEMGAYLRIKHVKNGTIMAGKRVSVIRVEPLNFNIKADLEKETITHSFQKFLNSLDVPIQILITTKKLDLNTYIDTLRTTHGKKELDDFTAFLTGLVEKNEIRNREFYVVIPETQNLNIQTRVCIERLSSLGLKVTHLNDASLLYMLTGFFDPAERTRQITDEHAAIDYLIAPNRIQNHQDCLITDSKYNRVIVCDGYPRNVMEGFLDRIIGGNDDVDISIHIEPFPIETTMLVLNKELQKQSADLYSAKKNGGLNLSLDIQHQDTIKVLQDLQKGKEKLFNVSLYINCKAKTLAELDFLTRKIEAELNGLMIIPKTPHFRMAEAYQSIMPLANDVLENKRNITTDALSAFFPFTSPFLSIQDHGVMLGLNKNKIPLIRDIFSLSNPNGLILATSGAGKSYATKLFIARQVMNGTKCIIIDPQGEYSGIAGQFNGEVITISKDSESIINPLDLMGHDYIEKRLSLIDIFNIMLGDLSEVQKSFLDKALNMTYARKGINIDSWMNKPPRLSDLAKELDVLKKKATNIEKTTLNALSNRLSMYTEGVFSFLNQETNINFNKDLVVFNIGDMPKQVKPVIMFLVLDFVYMKMKKDKDKKLLVVDEAWSLLSRANEAGYLFEIVKTCRKYNMGLLLITQDVADLVNSNAGGAVLANTAYTLLLRQKPAVIDSVVRTFNLSPYEKNYLLTADLGHGVIIMDNEHQEIQIIASAQEHEKITTNPNETKNTAVKKDDREDVNIDLDVEEGYYRAKDLPIDKQNFLINHGYEYSDNVPIGKTNQERYLVKTNQIEGKTHTFLAHNIKKEIEKYTKIVEINVSEKPDIVFTLPDESKYAIEVETGTLHKKRITEKIKLLQKDYQNNWIIALTNWELITTYKKYTNKITLRQNISPLLDTLFHKEVLLRPKKRHLNNAKNHKKH